MSSAIGASDMLPGYEYDSTQNHDLQEVRPPWRVLSLDGGGVRGLAELLILEKIFRVMKQILVDRGARPESELRPCDYFDLIGGTAMGGLFAIILGRLRLNLRIAIEIFQGISKTVFSVGRRKRSLLKKSTGGFLYDEETFATEIKRVVRLYYANEDLALKETLEPKCRVFVCTTKHYTGSLQLLRSYNSIDDSYFTHSPITIWEAARATTVARSLFKPMTIERSGGVSQTMYDGVIHENNPIYQVMMECSRLENDREVGCVVSLGTGVKAGAGPKTSSNQSLKLVTTLADQATSCDTSHRRFIESPKGQRLNDEQKYFRFDIARDLDEVGLDDWENFNAIQDYVDKYVGDNRVEIKKCAELLLNARLDEQQTASVHNDFASVDHLNHFTLDTASVSGDSPSADRLRTLTLDEDPEQQIADEINAADDFLEQGCYDEAYAGFQLVLTILSKSPKPMPSSFHCHAHMGMAECRILTSDDGSKESALEYLKSAYKHGLKALEHANDASRPAAEMALLVMTIKQSEMEAGPNGMSPVQVSTFYGQLNGHVKVLEYLIDGGDGKPQQSSYKGLVTRGLELRKRLIYIGSEGQAFQGLPPHYG